MPFCKKNINYVLYIVNFSYLCSRFSEAAGEITVKD
jgi:hypothetical protein